MKIKAAVPWTSPLKRRQFFEGYARDNGFDYHSPKAWYAQTKRKILSTKGAFAVIEHHKCSVSQALIDLFPDIGLEKRGFQAKKWSNERDRRAVFENYAREHGFDFLSPRAWYSQSYFKLNNYKGVTGVLGHYNNSLSNALTNLFPEIGLDKSNFTVNPQQHAKNRRAFFDDFAKSRNFDPLIPDNWYTVQTSDVVATKGRSILSLNEDSIVVALTKAYPSISLDKHKFISQRKSHVRIRPTKNIAIRRRNLLLSKKKWYSRNKRRNFFESYAETNGFDYRSPDAWYSQNYASILAFEKAAEVLKYYKNNVSDALVDLFPEIGLDKSRFKSHLMQTSPLPVYPGTINQDFLAHVVQDLFLSDYIVNNSRKKSQVINPISGNFYEIDVWVPDHLLGFEYQDLYHYANTWYSQITLEQVQQRDSSKKARVTVAGTTLVQVPCWWNGTPASLAATIHFERPDLMAELSSVDPIPLNPSITFFNGIPYSVPMRIPAEEVPGVGSLMLASFPLDPDFSNSIVRHIWWMGEKYDGMRCCWNPELRAMYSRPGRHIPLPDSIVGILPNMYIDGEFWFGRGMFSSIYSLLHGTSSWLDLRMLSFDIPHRYSHCLRFEERYEILLNSIVEGHPIATIAPRILCEGSDNLNSFIGQVIEYGGEGMILRKVFSPYEPGRNTNLLKLKASQGDSEGLVVGVDSHAVTIKLPDSQILDVPMSSVHVRSPPLQFGEVVTFSYENFSTRDARTHVEIIRRRSELKWEDVIANSQFHLMQGSEALTNGVTTKKILHESGPQNSGEIIRNEKVTYSTSMKRRRFFEKYAAENSLDFLSPEAWYSHPKSKLKSVVGAATVLGYHDNSVSRALMDLFPDIGLEQSRFKKTKSRKSKQIRLKM